jgi:hypothetical protein
MKKIVNNIQFRFFLGILLTASALFASCEDKDKQSAVTINSVWTNQLDTESAPITASYNGLWVRLEGSGFSGLQAIYCNGVKCDFQPTFVTENYITFQIASSVPQNSDVKEETDRGVIRVLTNHGEGIYRDFLFKDKNKMPAISGVSYTLPEVGDVITIEGNNLENTTEVYFPAAAGEVAADPLTIAADTRSVRVTVPAGTGDTSGAIRIVCNGDPFYSPNYMFFRKGVFIRTFSEADIITGNQSHTKYVGKEKVAAATGLSQNPENAISWKTSPANVPIGTGYFGYVRLLANKGFRWLIENSDGAITGGMKLADLAIQFDLYCNVPWSSGSLVLRMDKDRSGANQQFIYNLSPWSVGSPYTFAGWRTMTVKFSQFNGLQMGTLSDYIDLLETSPSRQQIFGFINADVNGDGHTANPIENFQMFMADVRLVPITVPEQ